MEDVVCTYPLDLRTYFNGKKKILNVESHLFRADAKKNESPYTNYGAFSLFNFTYIDKTGPNVVFVDANIRPDDIPDIAERAHYANRIVYDYEAHMNPAEAEDGTEEGEGNSPAYTVRFTSGKLKGKTPAEVLSENPGKGKEILNNQFTFLKSNLEKYPKNKEQMDAIVDAGKLLASGELKEVESVCTAITILKPEMRPLKSRPMHGTKTFVYEIGITCEPTNNYPYKITIENYYAPVKERDDKTLNVFKSDAQENVKRTFNMTTKDFNGLIAAIQTNMRQFESIIAKNQFNDAYKYDNLNRQNARRAASGE